MVIPPDDPASAFRLDGRVAIVTGASRGIGLAIAEVFARAGAAGLVLNARKAEGLDTAQAELEALGVPIATVAGSMADAGVAEALVETAMLRFGRIDVVVNNAGTNPSFANLVDADPTAVRKIFEVNVEGPLALVRAAWLAVMNDAGGSVINMASIGGVHPMPMIGAYNTSKAALIHLTKQLAVECAPKVRVNALAPGIVKTHFARALWEPDEDGAAHLAPLQRLGLPVDVAHAALYLASDASAWVTGTVLTVDGGTTLR